MKDIEIYKSQRRDWGKLCPVTKKIESKKRYNRKKMKKISISDEKND